MVSVGLVAKPGIGLIGLDKNGSTPALREGIPIPMVLGGGTLDPVPETLSVDPSVVSVVVPSVVVVVRMSEPLGGRFEVSVSLDFGCTSGGKEPRAWSRVGRRVGINIPGIGPGLEPSTEN